MIFYFSGTGNTKWAVRELEKATGEESDAHPWQSEITEDQDRIENDIYDRTGHLGYHGKKCSSG